MKRFADWLDRFADAAPQTVLFWIYGVAVVICVLAVALR